MILRNSVIVHYPSLFCSFGSVFLQNYRSHSTFTNVTKEKIRDDSGMFRSNGQLPATFMEGRNFPCRGDLGGGSSECVDYA